MPVPITWQAAMSAALYGSAGFFVAGAGPAAHFRTSAHAVPVLGTALLRLLDRVDAALGRPDRLDVVDVGAGRGELLSTLARLAPPELARRLRLIAVELAPRPGPLAAGIDWRRTVPDRVTGLLLGTEWLDNVPLDVAAPGPAGWHRLLVDPTTGIETIGGPVGPVGAARAAGPIGAARAAGPIGAARAAGPIGAARAAGPIGATDAAGPIGATDAVGAMDAAEAAWLAEWWPADPFEAGLGGRAEIGLPRDTAWAAAVAAVDRGLALAVDYGHLRDSRPVDGTLTGFRAGRQVLPVPDGSCDLTAHVAMDSVAAAGSTTAGLPYRLVTQRAALRSLGADGARPPLALAATDPAGYVQALARASTAAELTDPAGLGGHWWLLQPVGVDPAGLLAAWG